MRYRVDTCEGYRTRQDGWTLPLWQADSHHEEKWAAIQRAASLPGGRRYQVYDLVADRIVWSRNEEARGVH